MAKIIGHLRTKGIICVYADLYAVTNKTKFANVLALSIAKAKAGKIDEIMQIIRNHIPPVKLVIRPGDDLGLNSGLELELSQGKTDIDATLARLYDLPEKIAKKKKKKMVVVFDEFQEISKLDGGQIEVEMRSKIQQHESVSYVFMGSQHHLVAKMFAGANRPLYHVGKLFDLGRISEIDFAEFIQTRFKSCGVEISNQAISRILELTLCHPYYTQQLCHEVWVACISKKSRRAETGYVEDAKEQLMKNQDYAYAAMWDSVSDRQRSILVAMATSGGGGIFSHGFREAYSLGPSSTVARAVRSLEGRGLVEKSGKRYAVSDAFFAEWLRRLGHGGASA